MATPIVLKSDPDPQWQWPESGPPKEPSETNLYWWKDSLKEENGAGSGTAMIRGIATTNQLKCEGWIKVESDRGSGRIFVDGHLDLSDGVIGDGSLHIRGGSGELGGLAGKDVKVEVENPKRYTIPL
jgi:hypothetical protein